MSTQLDPVTGAPLLTPDLGTIDQLPYKVQPVPLADQTNQPQLGRTYLYPDDVPPVLANLNAMNGTQPDQAQTLHTDGSHALLVSNVGGGGGTSPVSLVPYTIEESTIGFGNDTLMELGPIGAPIYGVSFAFTFAAGSIRPDHIYGNVSLLIRNTESTGDFILAAIPICVPQYVGTDLLCGSVNVWWERGVKFPTADNNGSGNYQLHLQSINVGGGNLIACIFMDQ